MSTVYQGSIMEADLVHVRARAFRASDRPEVVNLLAILPMLYPGGDRWLQRRLTDSLEGMAECTVVEDTRTRDLCAVAIVTPKLRALKLSTFYVAENHRLRGVGKFLLSDLIDSWERRGQLEAYVTVAHHLDETFAKLVQPAGFLRLHEEKNRYGVGRHEVIWIRSAVGPEQGDTVLDRTHTC